MAGELGGGGRLARTGQPDEHDADRRRTAQVERSRFLAEQPLQLAVDELDEVLLGAEAPQHVLAERVLPDRLDEVADDADVDVGFEQREPDVPERVLDVPLADPSLALQLPPQALELLTQGFEHAL